MSDTEKLVGTWLEARRAERERLRDRDFEEFRDEHGVRAWAGAEK